MDGNTPLYPAVKVSLSKLKDNLIQLKRICAQSGIQIAGVVKGFTAIPAIAAVYDEVGFDYIASSRLEQLAPLKKQSFKTPLLHIRIAMPSEIKELVKIADASLQSEISTIRLIDEESKRQGKTHGIILMCDLGDLREGYFYSTNLAAIRSHVKINFDIHRMIPICVDLDYQFILFPLNSSKNKNVYFLNLSKVYRFFKRENQTVIEFICGEELVVDIPLSQCESQYNKATRIYDKYVKFKQFRERYLSTTVETIYTINHK